MATSKILKFSLVAALYLTALILTFRNQFLYQIKTSQAFDYHPKPYEETQATRSGYILVTDFSDQMTGAAINILSLQCWAGTVSDELVVIEPFVSRGSSFGANLSRLRTAQTAKQAEEDINLRLQDVLNMESWEEQIRERNYVPFKRWKAFLESAPMNLIVVGKACGRYDNKNCNDHFYKSTSLFAKEHSFNIVRSIQLEFEVYSFKKFRDLIYGNYKPNQSVVVFHHWGGLVAKPEEFRIAILEYTPCARKLLFNFLFENSPKIVEDSKRYLDRYMPKVDYISVMLRLELLLEHHNLGAKTSQEQKLSLIIKCVKGIVNQVSTMQKLHDTTRVFLTVDCQKHGSDGFRNASSPHYMRNEFVNSTMKILFRELKSYGLVLSMEEWEASFREISSFQIPGYVALLQKNVAASGTCLVTAGGGSFQKSAVALYKSIHNSKKMSSKCYTTVQEC